MRLITDASTPLYLCDNFGYFADSEYSVLMGY